MKMLHIPTGGLLPDGIFSCIEAYLTAFSGSDIQATLLATNTPTADMLARAQRMNCQVVQIGNRKTKPWQYYRKLQRYLKTERFDIVHVHGSSAIMSIELSAAKRAHCRVRIAHSHNTTCDNMRLHKLLLPIFNRMYSNAFACGNDAGRWLFGEKEFTVIPNGRDLDKFRFHPAHREKWRSSLGIGDEARVYGHVGAFNYQKNHAFLIEVFHEIANRAPGSVLILVGSGENVDPTKEQVHRLGLDRKVIFMGSIECVDEVLSACDMMLFPSRFEGLPLVVLEWQANGLPCVISDTITDECCITGWVRKQSITDEPGRWSDLARTYPLPDREEASKVGCAQLRERGYDITVEAERLKAIYRKLLKEASV